MKIQLDKVVATGKRGGRPLRPFRAGVSEEIVSAIQTLRAVRGKLRGAGAKRAAAAVARALKSVEGALRHASRIQDVAGGGGRTLKCLGHLDTSTSSRRIRQ